MADYDTKGFDLRTYYAQFGRIPLNDGAIWCLSLASSTLPDRHIGYQAWITMVADADCYLRELRDWAIGLGETIAGMKPKRGARARTFCEAYKPEWGRQASCDGMTMALGQPVPSVNSRSERLGVHHQQYEKIRKTVAAAASLQVWQFEDALSWAVRMNRRAA